MNGRRRASFRHVSGAAAPADSPRALFRDLPRDPDVPFLWEHQGRILEGYEEAAEESDLALELPTGTGKTLIGLLIAEWRRRAFGERVVYLCPTRQLVHQVGALARLYGIDAQVCLRPEYEGIDRWQSGDVIAIGTYAALFNYNPRFTAPQALILDDAHAAEDYVAGHWSVTIDRHEMREGYREIAALLDPVLDRPTAGMLTDDESAFADRRGVELVPLPRWWPLADPLREIVGRAVRDTDEWFAWDDHVGGGLAACSLLVSWGKIVLQPLAPATAHHEQFAGATQRVYMSATLGSGGELERIFGVRRIKRLPAPEEVERHSTGRRLFLLPAASLPADGVGEVVTGAIEAAGRALVLVPTMEAGEDRRTRLALDGVPTLGAADIEESLDSFTDEKSVALILANRYDGIDLPGDACRLVVLDGLPVAVNLLERFLHQRLSATALLSERMRTRFTQGVGRATRGEGDWCAVLVTSREAYDFCARGEVRELLHPEMQGELRFGLEQSRDRGPGDFLDLLESLLERDEEWQVAEEEIRRLRDGAERKQDPAAGALEAAVPNEIDFTYAMWDGDYPRALAKAVSAADLLEGDAVAPYRAWWLYQAGAAAWLAYHSFEMEDMLSRSRDLFGRAASTGRSVHWFAELAYGELGEERDKRATAPRDLRVVERAQACLQSIGFHGSGLKRRGDALRSCFDGEESTPWEEGVTLLGRLLGFETSHPGGQGDPDSVWLADGSLAIAWEIKSEESSDGEIGTRTIQQARGHEAWARANLALDEDATVLTVLASDRRRLAGGAEVHAAELCIVGLDEVREIAEATLATLRRVRAQGRDSDDASLRTRLIDELARVDLLPSELTARITARRVAELA